jgi:hypothetical protein
VFVENLPQVQIRDMQEFHRFEHKEGRTECQRCGF